MTTRSARFPSQDEWDQVRILRARILQLIAHALECGAQTGFSYEGTVTVQFPDFWDESGAEPRAGQVYALALSSAALGTARHYVWEARTLTEAVQCAHQQADVWARELEYPTKEKHYGNNDGPAEAEVGRSTGC